MIKLKISGNGLSFDQDISSGEALRIMRVGLNEDMPEGGGMEVSLRGDCLAFQKEIPSNIGMEMMNLVVGNEDYGEEEGSLGITEIESLVEEIK